MVEAEVAVVAHRNTILYTYLLQKSITVVFLVVMLEPNLSAEELTAPAVTELADVTRSFLRLATVACDELLATTRRHDQLLGRCVS